MKKLAIAVALLIMLLLSIIPTLFLTGPAKAWNTHTHGWATTQIPTILTSNNRGNLADFLNDQYPSGAWTPPGFNPVVHGNTYLAVLNYSLKYSDVCAYDANGGKKKYAFDFGYVPNLKPYLFSNPGIVPDRLTFEVDSDAAFCTQLPNWLSQNFPQITWICQQLQNYGVTGWYAGMDQFQRGFSTEKLNLFVRNLRTAGETAHDYFNLAIKEWNNNKTGAMFWLGMAAHMVQDCIFPCHGATVDLNRLVTAGPFYMFACEDAESTQGGYAVTGGSLFDYPIWHPFTWISESSIYGRLFWDYCDYINPIDDLWYWSYVKESLLYATQRATAEFVNSFNETLNMLGYYAIPDLKVDVSLYLFPDLFGQMPDYIALLPGLATYPGSRLNISWSVFDGAYQHADVYYCVPLEEERWDEFEWELWPTSPWPIDGYAGLTWIPIDTVTELNKTWSVPPVSTTVKTQIMVNVTWRDQFGRERYTVGYSAPFKIDPPTKGAMAAISPVKNTGQTFSVDIKASNVSNLWSWEAGMTFDPAVLQCVSFEQGPFLIKGGPTIWTAGAIDNTKGVITPFRCSLINVTGNTPVSGSGVLAKATFRSIALTNSSIRLANVGLYDNLGAKLEPLDIVDGYFTPTHDIAVKYVTIPDMEVYPGWPIKVTVGNFGNYNETVNVTAYCDNIVIGAHATRIPPQTDDELDFIIPFEPDLLYANYRIKVEVNPVSGEEVLKNNKYLGDFIMIKMTGDVNCDRKVDIRDIAAAAKAFGSYPGHPRWNMQTDIIYDGKIDIRDIAAIARKFGWKG